MIRRSCGKRRSYTSGFSQNCYGQISVGSNGDTVAMPTSAPQIMHPVATCMMDCMTTKKVYDLVGRGGRVGEAGCGVGGVKERKAHLRVGDTQTKLGSGASIRVSNA